MRAASRSNNYGTAKVQKQNIKLTDSGTWDADTSNINFAPTVSCDWDGSTGAFTAYREKNGADTEEAITLGAITNNLSTVSDYESSWTGPTVPTF